MKSIAAPSGLTDTSKTALSAPISPPTESNAESPELKVYAFLARRKWPKSYLGKIMLVAFLGTHIPLLTLFAYSVSISTHDPAMRTRFLLVSLFATLVGTGLTLLALRNLLAPITATFRGLRNYLEKNELPQLPTQYTDEAGVLMGDTMSVIRTIDATMDQLKNYDSLTGLPNRALFCDRAQQALSLAKRQQNLVAFLVFDIEDFSAINHSIGRQHSDSLLRQVASRLRDTVRETDVLSRLNNDEFALLHIGPQAQTEVSAHVQRLMEILREPFQIAGQSLTVDFSLGVALADSRSHATPADLLRDAEAALRDAKAQGRNQFRYHASEMNERMRQRLETVNDLRGALERSEFEVWYQPQFDTRSQSFFGMEALVRWHHPQRGLVAPLDFIPIAEESGLIVPIGKWVLQTACAQARAWQEQGLGELRIAINLSATQFTQPDLVEMVRQTLEETGLTPALLELEITESLLMNAESALKVLGALHELGVTLALDDFGTGFSSLSYLNNFPLDVLKIDRSFINSVPHDPAITNSIVALAKGLRLEVIAEGIETGEQSAYLHEIGCHRLQGFHFSRPLPAAEFARFVGEQVEQTVAA